MDINWKQMKRQGAIILLLSIYSCDNRKEKIAYYDDNKTVKSVTEYKGDIKDGKEVLYFRDGVISAEAIWSNGKKNGAFRQYYHNGAVAVKGNFYNDKVVGEKNNYGSNGKELLTEYFDSLGRLFDYKEFNENGTRNENMKAVLVIERDTVNIGDTVKYIIKLANVSDLRYQNGRLFVGSEFKVNVQGQAILKDTLAILKSKTNSYPFQFTVNKHGIGYIRGSVVVQIDSEITDVFPIEYKYYVR